MAEKAQVPVHNVQHHWDECASCMAKMQSLSASERRGVRTARIRHRMERSGAANFCSRRRFPTSAGALASSPARRRGRDQHAPHRRWAVLFEARCIRRSTRIAPARFPIAILASSADVDQAPPVYSPSASAVVMPWRRSLAGARRCLSKVRRRWNSNSRSNRVGESYFLRDQEHRPSEVDWRPMIEEIRR